MQNLGRKNFDDSTCIRQICQTFPPSKCYAIRYVFNKVPNNNNVTHTANIVLNK